MVNLTDKIIAVIVPFVEGLNLTNERLVWNWLKDNPKENGGFNDEFKIIGTITKLETNEPIFDFDCEKYVERLDNKNSYKDYELEITRDCEYILNTKEESFISLLNSKGIFLEELNNQKLLILEKICTE